MMPKCVIYNHIKEREGATGKDLAEVMGLTEGHLVRVARGISGISDEALEKMLKHYRYRLTINKISDGERVIENIEYCKRKRDDCAFAMFPCP